MFSFPGHFFRLELRLCLFLSMDIVLGVHGGKGGKAKIGIKKLYKIIKLINYMDSLTIFYNN